jgi:hypothetical protein
MPADTGAGGVGGGYRRGDLDPHRIAAPLGGSDRRWGLACWEVGGRARSLCTWIGAVGAGAARLVTR